MTGPGADGIRALRGSLGNAILGLGGVVPLGLTVAVAGRDLIVPVFHSVGSEAPPHVRHLSAFKDEQRFAREVDALLRHYAPVTAGELTDAVRHGRELKGKRHILFTFDDGLRENHDIIAPILKHKGVPAVFFLITGCIDNRRFMYRHEASLIADTLKAAGATDDERCRAKRILEGHGIEVGDSVEAAVLQVDYGRRSALDEVASVLGIDLDAYLAEKQPYLTSEQVTSLVNDGFDVGAHSLDHPRFAAISYEEQVRQAVSSLREVRIKFGVDGAFFAFPFNDGGISRALFDRIAGEVDLSFGTAGLVLDEYSWNIQRLPMDSAQTSGELLWRPALLQRYSALKKAVRHRRMPVWTSRRLHL